LRAACRCRDKKVGGNGMSEISISFSSATTSAILAIMAKDLQHKIQSQNVETDYFTQSTGSFRLSVTTDGECTLEVRGGVNALISFIKMQSFSHQWVEARTGITIRGVMDSEDALLTLSLESSDRVIAHPKLGYVYAKERK
jgi:hypothetical protein